MLRSFFIIASFYIGTLWSLTPQEIDLLAEQTLQTWSIPGLALVVIHKGEEIRIKGYGFQERDSDKRVDTQTLFPINSLSKAFTALTVSMLVEEEKIGWDVPIRAYLSEFQSKDPVVIECLNIKDLLCHRGGLPGNLQEGWRLFINTERSIDELLHRLAFIDQAYPFRSRFNYDNFGYGIAGEIVAKTSGTPWAEFCRQRIFVPLNMHRTTTAYSVFEEDENAVKAHLYKMREPIEGYNWEKDSLEAASGIISCADDMALWLNYCLTNRACFADSQQPLMVIYPHYLLPETELSSFACIAHGQSLMHYGMGWWMYHLDNKQVYRHTGSSPGIQSVLAIVPEEQLGIVILSNQGKHPAVSCLMNQLLDSFLDRPKTDWQQQGHKAFSEAKENEMKWLEDRQAIRNQDSPSTLPLKSYAGNYTHLGWGSILITENEGTLDIELLFSHEKGVLAHWENNQFEILDLLSGPLRPFLCEFMISPEGDITALKIPDLGLFTRS